MKVIVRQIRQRRKICFHVCPLHLTVILDPFGEAPLQTLVHGLQACRNGFLPELPRLRTHQLFQG